MAYAGERMERPKPHPHGPELARWARDRVRQELGGPAAARPTGEWIAAPGATFVTFRWTDGRLQGCRGNFIAQEPIVDDVARNAIRSALHDPRTRPLRHAEDLDQIDVEVSILTPLEPIEFDDEQSALAAIEPGVDGILFEWREHSSTFLPSMWKHLPAVRDFMGELKMKAGLTRDFWDGEVKLYRYFADKHDDPAVRY